MLKPILVVTGILFGSLAAHAEDPFANPYVVLYRNRVEIARTTVDRQQAIIDYRLASYQRLQRLRASGAASQEELDAARSEYEVARLTKANLEVLVTEAENLLTIAEVRTSAGQEMPICTPYDRPYY